jgi:hypothetical protein
VFLWIVVERTKTKLFEIKKIVPQTSRGGQNFQGGGKKTLFCTKNQKTILLKKVQKYTIYNRQGGIRAPLPTPNYLRTPMPSNHC